MRKPLSMIDGHMTVHSPSVSQSFIRPIRPSNHPGYKMNYALLSEKWKIYKINDGPLRIFGVKCEYIYWMELISYFQEKVGARRRCLGVMLFSFTPFCFNPPLNWYYFLKFIVQHKRAETKHREILASHNL